MVEVPFGNRELAGFVLKLSDQLEPGLEPEKLKPLNRLLDPEPIWEPELLELAEWLRLFYATTWQAALQTVIPGPVLARLRELMQVRKPRESSRSDSLKRTRRQPVPRPRWN